MTPKDANGKELKKGDIVSVQARVHELRDETMIILQEITHNKPIYAQTFDVNLASVTLEEDKC